MIFSDGYRKIEIEDSLIERMLKYRQTKPLSPEAGGVLFRRELIDTDNLIINNMTEPYTNDKRSRFLFHRKDTRHIEYYNNLYDKSGGIVRYVGEWHSHPEELPSYSFLDRKEWRKILKEEPSIAPLYFIIIGTKAWRVWKVEMQRKLPSLVFEQYY